MSAPLSDAQGYQLVRVGKKWQLPVDLQKLIWADVTGRYHRRHGRWGEFGLSVIEKAHVVIQTAARRMLTILRVRMDWGGGPTRRVPHIFDNGTPNGIEGIRFVRNRTTNKVFSRLYDARSRYGYGINNEMGNLARGIERTSLGSPRLPWLPLKGTPRHHHETYF